MIGLFIDGKQIGTITVGDEAFAQSLLNSKLIVEARGSDGHTMGRFASVEPLVPWDPNLTMEEIERRGREGPWYTFDEMKERQGWK